MSKSNLSIRKATKDDLVQVMQIIKSCTKHMISKNIFQWKPSFIISNQFRLATGV